MQWLQNEMKDVKSLQEDDCMPSLNQIQILLQQQQAVIQYKLNKVMENSSKKNAERVDEHEEEKKEDQAELREEFKVEIESNESNKKKSAFGNYNILHQMRQSNQKGPGERSGSQSSNQEEIINKQQPYMWQYYNWVEF